MKRILLLVLITFVCSLSVSGQMPMESAVQLSLSYAPRSATKASAKTMSTGSLITQMGLSGGSIMCVGDAQDPTVPWVFKHRLYSKVKGQAAVETDLSEKLSMEVLGYSEVGAVKSASASAPKSTVTLGRMTSTQTVKVRLLAREDVRCEMWGSLVVNYSVLQEAGRREASWVPGSISLKMLGVWAPEEGEEAGSAGLTVTMGAFKSVAADSIQLPATQVKVAGQSAVLNGNITGSEAMSYQWFKDGVAVVGGTSSSLVIPALGPVHAGNYRVEARNGFGAVQRSYVTLAVFGFTQQPQGASVVVGAPITLSAQAQGGESPVSYQWYKGAQLVTGATGSILSIGSATLANAGTYSVKASAGGATLTSNSVQVSVRENIALDVSDNFSTGISSSRWTSYQKLSGSMNVVGASGHASFLVSSSSIGSQEAILLWNTRLRTDVDWSAEIRGRNTAPYSANGGSKLGLELHDARLLNNGTVNTEYGDRYLGVKFTRGSEGYLEPKFQYWVNDSWQQDISAATVTDFKLKVGYQAADQTFNFWVETTGAGSDWELIGTSSLYELVPDATAASELLLTIGGKTRYGPISEGQLWVDDFRLIQAAAQAAAVAIPTITTQPGNKTVAAGSAVTLNVVATGSGLSYQWRKDGVNIPGATGSSYSIASVQSANQGNYTVVVSNTKGNITSQSAQLSVAGIVEVSQGWQLFVGSGGGPGHGDGVGTNARFYYPSDVAVDQNGNVYVADSVNSTIRKITPSGVVSTLAGAPTREGTYKDGMGSAARFLYPEGIAVDQNGNVYVADRAKIRKVTPSGQVTTLAGSGTEGASDGSSASARFNRPLGLCVDNSGNVYVADTGNHTVRKISPSGTVSTIAGKAGMPGYRNGAASASLLFAPQGVAVDGTGNVYVAEESGVIRKISPTQGVSKLAGEINSWTEGGTFDGFDPSKVVRSDFSQPSGICADSAGNLYVVAGGAVLKISTAGTVIKLSAFDGETFPWLTGITVDSNGVLYVADNHGNNVRKVHQDGTSSIFAGGEGFSGTADGLGASARFSYPNGMAVSSSGSLFIGGTTVRQVTPDGMVTSHPSYGWADGLAAVDAGSNLYVINWSCVEMVNPEGARSVIAGSANVTGSVDGLGANARFKNPRGMALGPNHTVYVADSGNHTIRKISSAGEVSTLAGLAGVTGSTNGTGSVARFNMPYGIAADAFGTLYVADSQNCKIRKITTNGSVTTLAGSGSWGGQDGTGTTATFAFPFNPVVDDQGSVYVTQDSIRKITAQGVVSTLSDGSQFTPRDICVYGKYIYALTDFGVWRMLMK